MEGFAKVLLILSVFLGALSMDVKGGRVLKEKEQTTDHPQTFGSIGGGILPSPFFSGSFPGPGSLGGSFPGPGFGGSFPSPSFGFGPSTFCSFPGVRCAPIHPNNNDGSQSGVSVSVSVSGSP